MLLRCFRLWMFLWGKANKRALPCYNVRNKVAAIWLRFMLELSEKMLFNDTPPSYQVSCLIR